MKKLFGVLIFLITCFMVPIGVKASDYGIENFNMHVTVLENGDLYVREAFSMNGTYNGMDRDIDFENIFASKFTGDKESFNGSDIYNGAGIELVQIRAIPYTNSTSWEEMETGGTKFTKTYHAEAGEFGVYTENRTSSGVSYRIYNPSSKKHFFYLEYMIKNMAVVHEDVAEVGWNIFNDNFRESIHHFKADIYIPNNQNLLKGYAHGPLVGNIELDGNDHIIITVDDLYGNTAMDTRFVFDKEAVKGSTKFSYMEALDTIVSVETEKAEIANQKREEARKKVARDKKVTLFMTVVSSVFGGAWLIGLAFLIFNVYKKHDKEYDSTFKTEYFRDFPADYNPSTVGYLLHQNVSNNDLSACLLNLIYKKVVTFEQLDKKDYKLVYHENEALMNASDRQLVKLIFKDKEITLNELKKKAKSGYSSFISNFNRWKNLATIEAKEENFYENKAGIKLKSSLYSVLGLVLAVLAFRYILLFGIIIFILALVSLIYFLSFTKKTPKGNDHYLKWKALKKFMEDFGTMDKKDLPEIVLWEKYLVYAVSLGCADKLSKTMQLRVSEFNDVDFVDIHYSMRTMRDMMVFNRIMSSTVTTAMNNAYSAQSIANSSNSSGGGFGGGFSGGGGSFGGGSGGGRF